jgi:hypothetical protein
MSDNKKSLGFIKLHKELVDWEWYSDIKVSRLFIHLLLIVNWKDKQWRGIQVKRGSVITSYSHLAQETNLSVRSIRTALNKLKNTQELTVKTTNKYSLLTIVNYSSYQSTDKQDDKQDDKEKTIKGQQPKKDKNIKKFIVPTQKDVLHYMTEKGFPNQAGRFCDFYESKGWMIGKNKMKDWKSAVRNWNRKDTPTSNQPKISL